MVVNGQATLLRSHDGTAILSAEGKRLNLTVQPTITALAGVVQQPKMRESSKRMGDIIAALSASTKYRLNPDVLRSPAVPVGVAVLDPSGTNLTAVVDEILTSPDRTVRDEVERHLRAAIPTLAGVSTKGGAGGKKSLEFTLAQSRRPLITIPAALASDGAMLLMGFLALAYGNTPEIVFIEEPENGVHYSLLGTAIDTLRKMTTGELGPRPRQVIVTTHSPLLLNFANPDEVRLFRRGPDSGTRVTPMAGVPNIESLLKELRALANSSSASARRGSHAKGVAREGIVRRRRAPTTSASSEKA